MRGVALSLMAAAVLLLPTAARGEEGKPHGRPDPEKLFQHLDKNNNGVIEASEVPDDVPPPLKALLAAADKRGDKKITKEAFLATAKERRDAMRREHGPMAGPPDGRRGPGGPPDAKRGPGPGGPPDAKRGPGPGGPPDAKRGPGPGCPFGERKPFDLKALFALFDKDKDGKLGLDEFTEGMKTLHEKIAARFRERRGPPPGACGPMGCGPRRDGPPGCYRGPGCPCFDRGPMPPWHRPHGYWGGGEPGRHWGPPKEWGEHQHKHRHPDGFKALEAKVNELDAKLKALEAKSAEAPKK